MVIWVLSGCNAYDAGLLDGLSSSGRGGDGSGGADGIEASGGTSGTGGSGGTGGTTGTGGTGGTAGTGGTGGDTSETAQCEPNPRADESCPEICPEQCDGQDNDCDGQTDEEGAGSLCELPHAVAGCLAGACRVVECTAVFGNCDLDELNGCETRLDTVDDCGGCGVECDKGSCAGGSCTHLTCEANTADCDRDPSNGCETSLDSSLNCGMCGNGCEIENASAVCDEEACRFEQCKSGFGDCNADAADGCETPLDTLSDCGSCGRACRTAQGEIACTGGSCTSASCDPGFADCDLDPTNGCEQPLNTLDNCGACGAECESGSELPASCETGVCEVEQCEAGFYDCDHDPLNGCESDLKDTLNCGVCAVQCRFNNASASCATGTCQFGTCDQGFADCNGNLNDGCEAQLGTTANCGGCNDACGSGEVCQDGSCMEPVCEILKCPSCVIGMLPCCKVDATCGCAWPATLCL